MFDAQTIHLQTVGTTSNQTAILYSPWFPRGGDYGQFTLEVVSMSGTSANLTLAVDMAHKKASDAGNGTDLNLTNFSIAASGSPSRLAKDVTNGFLELVRYRFLLKWGTTAVDGTQYWATFRMLSPVWYDKV